MNLKNRRVIVYLGILVLLGAAWTAKEPAPKSTKTVAKPDEKASKKITAEKALLYAQQDRTPFTEVPCKAKLLQAYGLSGQKMSLATPMFMCPLISDSCCSVNDLKTLKDKWFDAKGKPRLEERFKYYEASYSKILTTAMIFQQGLKEYVKRPLIKPECLKMGEILLQFNIKKIEQSLKNLIQKSQEFYKKSYEGLFCALCDAKNHVNFNENKSIVTLSIGFCRSLIQKNLLLLIYHSMHMPRVVNLMTTMVNSCDRNGNFTETKIPEDQMISADVLLNSSIKDCKSNHDSRDKWFKKCEPLCKKFSVVTLHPDLNPNVFKYAKLSAEIDTKKEKMFAPADPVPPKVLAALKNPEKNIKDKKVTSTPVGKASSPDQIKKTKPASKDPALSPNSSPSPAKNSNTGKVSKDKLASGNAGGKGTTTNQNSDAKPNALKNPTPVSTNLKPSNSKTQSLSTQADSNKPAIKSTTATANRSVTSENEYKSPQTSTSSSTEVKLKGTKLKTSNKSRRALIDFGKNRRTHSKVHLSLRNSIKSHTSRNNRHIGHKKHRLGRGRNLSVRRRWNTVRRTSSRRKTQKYSRNNRHRRLANAEPTSGTNPAKSEKTNIPLENPKTANDKTPTATNPKDQKKEEKNSTGKSTEPKQPASSDPKQPSSSASKKPASGDPKQPVSSDPKNSKPGSKEAANNAPAKPNSAKQSSKSKPVKSSPAKSSDKSPEAMEAKYKDGKVIEPSFSAIIDLAKFTIEYDEIGINVYEYGLMSMMSSSDVMGQVDELAKKEATAKDPYEFGKTYAKEALDAQNAANVAAATTATVSAAASGLGGTAPAKAAGKSADKLKMFTAVVFAVVALLS